MSDAEFRVPYGLAHDGRLVVPAEVDRAQRYRCPECEAELVFRLGDFRRAHFAHPVNGACEPESIAHKTAKLLVAQVVNDWKAGCGPAPVVERTCGTCAAPWRASLPERIVRAQVEAGVDRWRVDVGLLDQNRVVAAVEILHTHRTVGEKAETIGVPWTELEAGAVIECPQVWRPVGGTQPARTCPACEERARVERLDAEGRRAAMDALGKALNQPIPARHYETGKQRCWKCRRDTLVYKWEGQPWCKRTPPEPRPRTVQFVFSKTVNHKYWANTCGACGALQGDNFLFNEPSGAFYGGMPVESQPSVWGGERSGSQAANAFLNRVLGRW